MTLTDHAPGVAGPRRKADHLRIAAGGGVSHTGATGLETVRLRHRALPERDLRDVSLRTTLLGIELGAPLVVSAMTGGTPEAASINARLAEAAAEHGIALTLGSGRALLDAPELLPTYRTSARPPLLLANLGAGELRRPDGPERAERLVGLVGATVERLAPLPVAVKEVGFGMDGRDVALLCAAGVAAVDVAGAGGTNWALVEGRRTPDAGALATAFAGWGVPTA